MPRVFNFSPGPAMIPDEVMHQAHKEFLDYQGLGYSVNEMSHRSSAFVDIRDRVEQDLRDLLSIPDNYQVLMMQGGATLQYSAVPLNLLNGNTKAAYLQTGSWSKRGIKEAKKYCDVNIAASNENPAATFIPSPDTWNIGGDEAYLYYVDNETIGGVEFHSIPDSKGLPLVADMSSNILTKPVDVSKYGLIFACSQKTLAPVGITLVIVRDDLIGHENPITPEMLSYKNFADSKSLYNTMPTFPWYMGGLMCDWIKREGGLEEMDRRAKHRSAKLYDYIDQSDFYSNPVDPACRSRVNVPFLLKDDNLNGSFLEGATAVGLANLKGHRTVGGMRASMYNSMPEAGVDALLAYMQAFEDKAS
ncbi:MAG: 3-phosphoserine/phosphohydroxythreonine transaminase [Coxiellaceae bacterium]|nr:3-phosphoserine/phosphohydroxythreonine transaminase [Coxiellaceae bacterium]